MKRLWFIVLALPLFFFAKLPEPIDDPKELLQNGPMLGYSEMREVLIWAQTTQEAELFIKYWEKGTSAPQFTTQAYKTNKDEGYTARLLADEILPGKVYQYQLYINNSPISLKVKTEFKSLPLWQWRGDPPTFSVAVGSCLYVNEERFDRPGTPYGGGYEIFETIHSKKPDLMIWLGDNTYYREADFNTLTGMIHRNTHTRNIKELQPLLASTHNYAIWDDHDYGPNDHNRAFIHKQKALDAFKMFWGNPTYGFQDEDCAVTQFDWGDVQFFMLDNRWFRSANHSVANDRPYFGRKQVDWLIDALKASRSNFKVVASGGQIINPVAIYENYANYKEERDYLLKRLSDERIPGVLFLSGDRHHAELSKMDREGAYPLYDLTTSPLTSRTHVAGNEENLFRMKETLVNERNFAILKFSGPFSDRELKMSVISVEGKGLWEHSISASELSYSKN